MKKTKKATSLIESLIILMVIISWIIWLYQVLNSSIRLSNTTKNRIEAIEIAREWIEAMKNIRDTNWLTFAWDKENCWNTLNYDSGCVWASSLVLISDTSTWILYQDNKNRWFLDTTAWLNFKVWKDTNWYYTQTWVTDTNKTIYTREINIEYTNWKSATTATWMTVSSTVTWTDNSKENQKVVLTDLISNWEK